MAASELLAPTVADAPEVAAGASRERRSLRVLLGALTIIVGALVAWVALAPLGDTQGLVKVTLCLIGIFLCLRGIHITCTGVWGPTFATSYWLGLAWVIGLSAAAAFADFLPLGEHVDTTKTIGDPGNLRPNLFSSHPLGTNNFSLDLLAQSIYGARVSLLTSGFAVIISLVIGGLIGVMAGYFRGWTDTGIGVLSDTLLAFPPLIVLVALAAALGRPNSVPDAIVKSGLALAVVGIPTMLRLARANTLVFAQQEFVLAARSIGAKHRRIIARELVPNVVIPLTSYAFIVVAILIIAEGSLSFLGLGLQQPEPTWGSMIAQADLTTLRDNPHIALVPGSFMFITVLAFNTIGEHARVVWNARDAKLL